MNYPIPANIRGAAGLRVALFAANYNYTRDGCNQALARLVGHLEDAGAAVRVYSPTTDKGAFAAPGEVVSVPSVSAPGRPEYRIALGLPSAIRADLARFAPTVVHLSAPDLMGHCAQRAARTLGVPAVASLHTRFETYLSYYRLGWLRPLVERRLAAFYGGCDHVVVPNAPMAEILRARVPGVRASVWGRGVDRDQFSPARRCVAWRRAAGIRDHEVAVLFFGRLVHEKGLGVFADTVDALARDLPVRPVIVGVGPAEPWLRARLPGAIFTGFLAGDPLGRAVASCDILLNPSLTETFGNVTLEAMASGLAVVLPPAPSTAALISPSHDGVEAPASTPAVYADLIRGLVLDPAKRRALGEAARRASQRFGWRECCDAVLQTYGEVGAFRLQTSIRRDRIIVGAA